MLERPGFAVKALAVHERFETELESPATAQA
jgi:hypothetical protein